MAYFSYDNKKIYYQEIGNGKPLIFLHGNTASSAMFLEIINHYTDIFKVILIDFLGNLTPMEIELVQLEKVDL